MKDFRTLGIWKRSHAFALASYKATREFPRDELFGITAQIRRSATSIPTNISEGCGRDSDAELKRFLDIAHGSASELASLLILARDLKLLPNGGFPALAAELDEIKRMIGAFSRRLRADR